MNGSKRKRSPGEALPRVVRASLATAVCVGGAALFLSVASEKYPVAEWLFWDLVKLLGLTAVFNTTCVAFGLLFLTRVLRITHLPRVETLLFSMALGVVVFCWGMYACGALGCIGTTSAIGLPVLGAGAVYLSRAWLPRLLRPRPLPALTGWRLWLFRAAMAWGICNIGLMYLQVMTPGSINYDAAWYHLTIAQDVAREGRIVPFYADYNRTYPQLTSLVHAWGFAVPGLPTQLRWVLALHVEFSIVLWKIVGVVAATRWMLGVRSAAWSWPVFFLFPAIAIYDQNIGGSADHFLGFFAVPAFVATARALPQLRARSCALAGVMLGGALLTKYQAIYMVVACSSVFCVFWFGHALRALRSKPSPSWRRLWVSAALLGGCALLVSAPHFVKNAVFYHNPVYPFAQGLFPTFPFHERSVLLFEHAFPDRGFLPTSQGLRRLWDAVVLFFTHSFVPHYSFNRDYLSAGSLFTLLIPCALLVGRSRRIALGIAVSFIAFVVWGSTYIVDRYLQAFMTLPIAVTAALLFRVAELGWMARTGLALLVVSQLVWGADAWFYSGHARVLAASNLIRSGYEGKRGLEQRFFERAEHVAITRATPSDAVILARNYRTTLGIDRTILSDVQSFQSYVWYEPLRTPHQLYDLYRSRGVTHLLYPPNQRPPSTLQAAVLFADLVANSAPSDRQRFGGLELVTLGSPPPQPTQLPYDVFVSGVPGYPAGRYHVEQLHVEPRLPAELRRAPQPIAPLPQPEAQTRAALSGVSAVVAPKRTQFSSQWQRELNMRFVAAEHYPEFSIYVRRR